MNKNDLISKFCLEEGQKIEIFKLLDKINIAEKKRIIRYSDFLDPYLYSISEIIIKNAFYICYKGFGGYENAERKIILFYPEYIDSTSINPPIKVVNIHNFPKNHMFSHREVLGSILSLGLKREKIGDIIINEDLIQIVVLDEVAKFIEIHLKKIGRYNIEVFITGINEIIPKKYEFIEINANVKSLRLDSICAVGFNESRNKTAADIKNGKIKVNYKPITSSSYNLNEGDMISYRTKGRIIFEKILGKTKKDRYKVLIKKFV